MDMQCTGANKIYSDPRDCAQNQTTPRGFVWELGVWYGSSGTSWLCIRILNEFALCSKVS